jgi:hypothetical protein
MPRTREGVKVLFVELPADLLYRLHAVAKVSRRSVTGQTTVAVEEHLAKHETDASRKLAKELAEQDERPGRQGSSKKAPEGGGRRQKKK